MTEAAIIHGATEISPVSTRTRRDDGLARRRTGTVGRGVPHLEIKVVAPSIRRPGSPCRAARSRTCGPSDSPANATARRPLPPSSRATRPTRRRTVTHCRGALAHYKVPRRVELMTPFPLTAGGEVRKVELRDWQGS